MYGSPRAATIRAKSDCVLWSLDRKAFKGITGSHKQKREEIILDTIRKVKIGDNVLGDVLHSSDIDAMALATETDSFSKGDVIIRQGERGDAFYIIESGSVDVFVAEQGDEPVARLASGQFFGEKALMSEDVRHATCIATTDVESYVSAFQTFRLSGVYTQSLSLSAATAAFSEAYATAASILRLEIYRILSLTHAVAGSMCYWFHNLCEKICLLLPYRTFRRHVGSHCRLIDTTHCEYQA